MEDLRYPVGKFHYDGSSSHQQKQVFLEKIAQTPSKLRGAVAGLADAQLDTPYRPGGWTVRQVVHHVPDSHLNAYTRFKLACTEEAPAIKTDDVARWAELAEARPAPIDVSLDLLTLLHRRWVLFLRTLGPADFARTV